MKLIAQVKLQPTAEQSDALRHTLLSWNAAANYISARAWETQSFRAYDLHHATYYDVRQRFDLTAQAAIRVIAVVADAYKLDRRVKRVFRPLGSMTYDNRILSWSLPKSQVSIWTMAGRQKIPFVCGERQRRMLDTLQGECDLVYRDGMYFLHQTINVPEGEAFNPDDWLGVDVGIANIAVDSDGTVYQGKSVKAVRYRNRQLRRKLQTTGTKSAKRRLKILSGREHRFSTDTNHVVSKQIVETAQRTGRGIAVEDLTGIRDRVRLRRCQRDNLHSWAFAQLRCFLEYKAKLHGVPLVAVDPRNTSRTCPVCGCIDKRNRQTQSVFLCTQCGHAGLADYIAATNIRGRAAVSRPNVAAIGPATSFTLRREVT
jgi:putative transposase